MTLEFMTFHINGSNYLLCALDAEMHLDTMNLKNIIKEENETINQEKEKAVIFLGHHTQEDLKLEYLTVKDSYTLWNKLKEMYDRLKLVHIPQACYD